MAFVICLVLLAGIGGIAVMSKKEQGELLERMSSFLYKRCCVYNLRVVRSGQVGTDLERLYPGVPARTLQMDYYIEKIRLFLVVLLVGTLLTFLLSTKSLLESSEEVQKLERGAVSSGGEEVRLSATVEGEKEEILVYVEERYLTEKELEALKQECIKELEALIPGENLSLKNVTKDLYLPDSLEGYPFEIFWKSSDTLLIGTSGNLKEVQGRAGENIRLTAELSYGEVSMQQDFLITLGEVERDNSLQAQLQEAIKEQDEASKYQEELLLPQEIKGQEIHWKKVQEENSLLFLGLTLLASAGVFFLKDKDLHEQVLERRRKQKMVYPNILNKCVLYMSAGMTVRGSFLKIAMDYQKVAEGKEKNPAYEEMLYSCNELKAGVSEGLVYERFGKRSGLQEYARFAGMLGQNLKKGNGALLGRLREESEKAMQENLQFRKKLGEEAETKLLLPMVMMMGIVMLLVMIPAFTSFG